MAWHGSLDLAFRRASDRTVVHDRHHGPLRLLKSLHPEGDPACHAIVVHPPGGIVGGDRLAIDVHVAAGAHALVTTPGATRFYRTTGAAASQHVAARVAAGARLEWLPLETLAYAGCDASSAVDVALAPGDASGAPGEAIGCDVVALGLPASNAPFERGTWRQSLRLGGTEGADPAPWLDRGTVRADDRRLLASPLGWDGRRVLATLWFASGDALPAARRDALLEAARGCAGASALASHTGATSPRPHAVVLRTLAPRVEPALALVHAAWSAWRSIAWELPATAPRVWRT
jgi:urease accessory protein